MAPELWDAIARIGLLAPDALAMISTEMVRRILDDRLSSDVRSRLAERLILPVAIALRDETDPPVSLVQTEQVLRLGGPHVGAVCARALTRFVADAEEPEKTFASGVLPILAGGWPRDRSVQSSEVADAFAPLPAAADTAFSEAVAALGDYLMPFDVWSLWEYRIYVREDGGGRELKFPRTQAEVKSMLTLLDRTIGEEKGAVIPHDLDVALTVMAARWPAAVKDRRFSRLASLARRGGNRNHAASMKGDHQHYIPQHVQRGFKAPGKGRLAKVWLYHCDRPARRETTLNVGAQNRFYSAPRLDGIETLDEALTRYENGRLQILLNALRSLEGGADVEADVAAAGVDDGGEVSGYEALLRWSHPDRGAVSPEVFIPIAEETGSIIQLGEWVLRDACTTAAAWRSHLSLSVNVSPIQFQVPNLVEMVQSILDETGLPATRLELEITETAMLKDRAAVLRTLYRFKALGVRIVMDDFGTGYSSLSNLQSFPFDKIKIDRSFVAAMEDDEAARSIIRAIVGIGRSLDLPVVAEGVETQAQHLMVAEEGCPQAQGYYFGRPGDAPIFLPTIALSAS